MPALVLWFINHKICISSEVDKMEEAWKETVKACNDLCRGGSCETVVKSVTTGFTTKSVLNSHRHFSKAQDENMPRSTSYNHSYFFLLSLLTDFDWLTIKSFFRLLTIRLIQRFWFDDQTLAWQTLDPLGKYPLSLTHMKRLLNAGD